VKLFVMPWGLKFDISCGVGSGIPAAAYIREQLQLWPPLKPLVTILKLFLLQRNMNEVYTGGLGSFALILSVVAFLKMHTSRLPWRGMQCCCQRLLCSLSYLELS
jgi:non-canonical poly(A) RNA polymerase PAPD5/7